MEREVAGLPMGLDGAASPQPCCTLAPHQRLILRVQAELMGGIPYPSARKKEASKITVLQSQHPAQFRAAEALPHLLPRGEAMAISPQFF